MRISYLVLLLIGFYFSSVTRATNGFATEIMKNNGIHLDETLWSKVAIGGNSGGGGNVPGSTLDEVEIEIQNLKEEVSDFLNNTKGLIGTVYVGNQKKYVRFLEPDEIHNPILRKMIPDIFGHDLDDFSNLVAYGNAFGVEGRRIFRAVRFARFQVLRDRPCKSGDGHSDAATNWHIGAEICMSAFTLSRYPYNSLRKELISLFFHEIAHQFGYGETEAVALQEFIRKKYELYPVTMVIFPMIYEQFRLEKPPQYLSGVKIDRSICEAIGFVRGVLFNSDFRRDFILKKLPKKQCEEYFGGEFPCDSAAFNLLTDGRFDQCGLKFSENDPQTKVKVQQYMNLIVHVINSVQ